MKNNHRPGRTLKIEFPHRIVTGIELESYTILMPEYRISRQLAFPRRGTAEKGENFRRDSSIGTEYNSRPFNSIREGLFLIKAGLRKYSHRLYRTTSESKAKQQLFLVGGWRDRYAGAHIHLSVAGEKLDKERAQSWAKYIHDFIPLLIAIGTNSPVWDDELTSVASNRISKASKIYFRPIHKDKLSSRLMDELRLNPGRQTKPPTLEIRVLDSNIPEFTMAAVCLIKAASLAWLRGKRIMCKMSHAHYLKSRKEAGLKGMKAKLCWNGRWITASKFLDRFVWSFRDELEQMDIPHEIWTTFRLLKKGLNGSALLEASIKAAMKEHPPTWQKRFAKRYIKALDSILSGNSIIHFIKYLDLDPPELSNVWLGRNRLKLL